jgi:hypothetical protein
VLVVLHLAGRWTPARFGLACPSCGAALSRYRHRILGAGTCGHCQAHVIEDAPIELSGAALPTREEFQTRLTEYLTAYRQTGNWLAPAVLLSFLPLFVVMWPVHFFQHSFRAAGLMWLLILLFFGAMIGPHLVCLYYVKRWENRLRHDHGLLCVWCGSNLSRVRDKTAETGRCAACGQPAWKDGQAANAATACTQPS